MKDLYSTEKRSYDWYYQRASMVNDLIVGPYADFEIVELMKNGSLKDTSNIQSKSITGGRWTTPEHVEWKPVCARMYREHHEIERELREKQSRLNEQRSELEKQKEQMFHAREQCKDGKTSEEHQAVLRAQLASREQDLAQEEEFLRREREWLGRRRNMQIKEQQAERKKREKEAQRAERMRRKELQRQESERRRAEEEQQRKDEIAKRQAEELRQKQNQQVNDSTNTTGHEVFENCAICCVIIASLGVVCALILVLNLLGNLPDSSLQRTILGSSIGILLEASFLWFVLAVVLRGFRQLLINSDKTSQVLTEILQELKSRK